MAWRRIRTHRRDGVAGRLCRPPNSSLKRLAADANIARGETAVTLWLQIAQSKKPKTAQTAIVLRTFGLQVLSVYLEP